MPKEELKKETEESAEKFFEKLFNFIDWFAPDRATNDLVTQMLICIQDKFYSMQKENAELKKKLKEKLKTIADKDLSFVAKFDALEKENAELKKKNLNTQDAVTMQMYTNKANKEIADRQLTKAKEIIKDLMSFSVQLCDCRHTVDFEKTREQAEQFLQADVGTKNYEEQDKILKTNLK